MSLSNYKCISHYSQNTVGVSLVVFLNKTILRFLQYYKVSSSNFINQKFLVFNQTFKKKINILKIKSTSPH